MNIRNKIKKHVSKINELLEPQEISKQESIHDFRVEVKRLEALLEAGSGHIDFNAGKSVPLSLENLYHAAGDVRKFNLAIDAATSITRADSLPEAAGFLLHLEHAKNKHGRNLEMKCKIQRSFEMDDFLNLPDAGNNDQLFLTTCSTMILALLSQDIMKDIASLHRLRRILKSVLYTIGLSSKSEGPLHAFLKSSKKLIKTTESKIGSLHDIYFFVKQVSKKYSPADPGEQAALLKIQQVWEQEIVIMQEEIKKLLPRIRRFALGLKEKLPAPPPPALQTV